MCVQVYVHVHVCVHPSSCRFMWCTEAKGRCFPQYFSLHCIWKRLLLNLEVASSDSHDGQVGPRILKSLPSRSCITTSPVALSFLTWNLGIEFRPSHFHSKLFTGRAISPASISEFLSTEHISVKVVKVEKRGSSNETDIWGLNIRSYIFSKTKCHVGSLPGQGWGGLIILIEISGKRMFQMALSLLSCTSVSMVKGWAQGVPTWWDIVLLSLWSPQISPLCVPYPYGLSNSMARCLNGC